MPEAIRATEDFERIHALPRRVPAAGADALVDALTAYLKTPTGTMRLRPLQALALHEIGTVSSGGTVGGGFLPLDVGEGKTLTSLLTPVVIAAAAQAAGRVGAQRPLLLLPANLIQKTARERDALAEHWRIPRHIRLMSYQMLGLVQSALELEQYQPDLIIADEVQKLKNRDAAVTRRVERYMERHPETAFVGMTGTIMRKSIRDFAHVLRWCLKDGAPVPLKDAELDEWALCLDERIENEFQRVDPGALLRFASPAEVAAYGEQVAARRGFRRRLRETPGIVASADTGTEVVRADGTPVRLEIRALKYDVSPVTDGHFGKLRDDGVTPDGWVLWEAAETWRVAKELALGFHYVQVDQARYSDWQQKVRTSAEDSFARGATTGWGALATMSKGYREQFDIFLETARPPERWRDAKRNWFAAVREVLSRSRTWDSPEHIAQACDAGKLPGVAPILETWRAIKDTFVSQSVAVWHDDSALRAAAAWMRKGPGIVWTEHRVFAEALSELTGAVYYGAKGFSDDGRFVDDGDADGCVIVSVDANREGRNLQYKWHRNLITSPAEGADLWQQLLGRTHRPGQTAPVVTADVFLGCAEHARAWAKATAGAYSIRDTVGSESKLLVALEGRDGSSATWPDQDEIDSWSGKRWQ